jgi:uncharacterized membrane protein
MKRGGRQATPWLVTLLRVLLVLLGSAPVWVPLLERVPVLGSVTTALNGWFSFHCHREAARSLAVFGAPAVVCARCFGIYAGLFAGALIGRPELRPALLRLWVALAALVMLLDVLTEHLGMRPEWVPLRLVTGFLLAYPAAVAVVAAAQRAR